MAESNIIVSERLLIAPFTSCFITEQYVGWLNDPEIVKYSEQRFKLHTMDSCRQYVRSFRRSPDYFWAISVKGEDQGHIGNITASVMPEYSTADLGILMGEKKSWGKGYATEAWAAVCDHLFACGFRKITAGTLSVNMPMRRLFDRAGMVEDGRRTKQAVFDGVEVDIVYAALFNKNWNPK